MSIPKRLALAAGFASTIPFAVAQRTSQTAGDAAASTAACGGCGVLLFLIVAAIVLNIAMLVWVARDAKARGMDSSVLWMLLVFFTSLLGLVIYLFARPQGNLVSCQNCGNKKLQAAMRCPHCGFGV